MSTKQTNTYVFYGFPSSLYSAKVRSYLIKQHIEFVERTCGDSRYLEGVVPQIGRVIAPVLETPDGELVQDTTYIIDFLEERETPRHPAYPTTPRQLAVAHALNLFGSEGLLRPAMHYRWNVDGGNAEFIEGEFKRTLATGMPPEMQSEVFRYFAGAMRAQMVQSGCAPTDGPLIEAVYKEFLELLDSHLQSSPYLLGGVPTIADYAFIGPLRAHLGRDPMPSQLMKTTAPWVYRWVERMYMPNHDAGEYLDYPEELFAGDAIPPTLRALLQFAGEETTAETVAQVAFLDNWLAEHPEISEGDVLPYEMDARFIGTVTTPYRGGSLETGVLPYRLLQVQRLHDAVEAMDPARAAEIREDFAEWGLAPLLEARPRRRMAREANREVWGAEQEPSVPGAVANFAV